MANRLFSRASIRSRTTLNRLALATALSVATGLTLADPTPVDTTAPAMETAAKSDNCLPIHSIRRTKIVDDQNILFFTNDGKVYNNKLPHRCSGLASADTFSYKTSQNELCNVDVITVLHQTGGSYMNGPSCGLGNFAPTENPDKAAKEKAAK